MQRLLAGCFTAISLLRTQTVCVCVCVFHTWSLRAVETQWKFRKTERKKRDQQKATAVAIASEPERVSTGSDTMYVSIYYYFMSAAVRVRKWCRRKKKFYVWQAAHPHSGALVHPYQSVRLNSKVNTRYILYMPSPSTIIMLSAVEESEKDSFDSSWGSTNTYHRWNVSLLALLSHPSLILLRFIRFPPSTCVSTFNLRKKKRRFLCLLPFSSLSRFWRAASFCRRRRERFPNEMENKVK